jgi:hypothetical protein
VPNFPKPCFVPEKFIACSMRWESADSNERNLDDTNSFINSWIAFFEIIFHRGQNRGDEGSEKSAPLRDKFDLLV